MDPVKEAENIAMDAALPAPRSKDFVRMNDRDKDGTSLVVITEQQAQEGEAMGIPMPRANGQILVGGGNGYVQVMGRNDGVFMLAMPPHVAKVMGESLIRASESEALYGRKKD